MENFKKRKKLSSTELNFALLFKRATVFTVMFFAISFVIMLIMSCVFYNTSDPTSKISIISLCALYLSSFVCGFLLSKLNGQLYLLGSFTLGIMIFLSSLLLSLFFGNEGFFATSLAWRALAPVFCIIGGFGGMRKEKQHHKRKRR